MSEKVWRHGSTNFTSYYNLLKYFIQTNTVLDGFRRGSQLKMILVRV